MLKPSRVKNFIQFAVAACFVAGGIWMGYEGQTIGYLCAAFFGVCLIVFAILFHPRAAYLSLTREGFTFCSLFRAHTVKWSEVTEFAVINIFSNRMVAWNFCVGCGRHGTGAALSKSVSGYESALPDTYGMKAHDLAALLDALRQQYGNVTSSVCSPCSGSPRIIQKTDIVGARIVDIHETYELLEGGCDCRVIYFTVDRGFNFTLPIAGLPWETAQVPSNAKRLEDEFEVHSFSVKQGWFGWMKFIKEPSAKNDIVKQIKQRVIAGVYCGPFDSKLGFHDPGDGVVVFEDGSRVSNTTVSPHGTGAAGLYFHKASECSKPTNQLVDYFNIPLEEDELGTKQ